MTSARDDLIARTKAMYGRVLILRADAERVHAHAENVNAEANDLEALADGYAEILGEDAPTIDTVRPSKGQ